MSGAIPQFGSINGVAGAPVPTAPSASLSTVIAMMYNYYDPTLVTDNENGIVTNSANRIQLNPFGYDSSYNPVDGSYVLIDESVNSYLTESEFLDLFYTTNAGYFNVNTTNQYNPAVVLNSQTYTSSNSLSGNFSLTQSLLKAFCTNKGVTVNDIDPRILVLLQKETFTCQSLAQVKGTCVSLSWDEVVSSLITSGAIIPVIDADADLAFVGVPLSVILVYHSFVLNIDLAVRFTYNVQLNGYTLPSSGYGAAQPTYNCILTTVPPA